MHFYHSNSLSHLFARLSERIGQSDRAPLEADHLILPNNDMGRWVQIHLAKEHGISANLVLEMPSSYMRRCYQHMFSGEEGAVVDKEHLNWIFYRLLKVYCDEESELKPIKGYIEAGGEQERELRRWQMAERIADVFDQYLIYRPDWISQWSHDQQPKECTPYAHARWQKWLWEKVLEHYPEIRTRAGLQAELIQNISEGSLDDFLPSQLYVFGLPSIAPVFVKTLLEISKRGKRVEWFRVSPSEIITTPGEEIQNPLLRKLSAECVEMSELLDEECRKSEVHTQVIKDFSIPDEKTLLKHLQKDLISNATPDEAKNVNDDVSLRIHSCHNPMREVEVLYDHILNYLDENPNQGPGDVLVLTPDIDTYAPVLEAVFGSPDDEEKGLPFTVADSHSGIQSEIADVLRQIIQAAIGRFKVTEVMQLLDAPLIRNKFRFERDDVMLLEKWVTETNIRWGWDEKHHEGEYRNSWKFGLDRMFAGLAYDSDLDRPVNQTLPYGEIEGGVAMQLLGRFRRFLEQLNQTRDVLRRAHTATQWKSELQRLTENFIYDDEDTTSALQHIRQKISDLEHIQSQWGVDDTIPFEVIQEWLNGVLEASRIGMGFRTGKVTCSAMVPVRNMPFRFIAILGMNDQAIPGSDSFTGFDLMGQIKQKGDRSRRNQDRGGFLDAILAADDRFHLSYIGFDQKDNSDVPPSTLITELLEYLDEHYLLSGNKPSKGLLHQHGLYGFDARYFEKQSDAFFTYSGLYARAAQFSDRMPKEDWYPVDEIPSNHREEITELTIDQLVRFLQKPAGEMLRNQLEIRLIEEEVLSEDRDPWLLNYLAGYRIRERLLEALIDEQPVTEVFDYYKADGIIPRGKTGSYRFDHLSDEVEDFVRQLKEQSLIPEYLNPVDIDLELDVEGQPFRIFGKLQNMTKSGNRFLLINQDNPKYRLMAWVYHLIAQLVVENDQKKTVLIMRNKGEPLVVEYQPVSDAEEQIEQLLKMYLEGMQTPLGVYPKASSAYVNAIQKNKPEEKAMIDAANKLFGSRYNTFPDAGDDPAIHYVFEYFDPIQQERFKKWADQIWTPLKNHEQ